MSNTSSEGARLVMPTTVAALISRHRNHTAHLRQNTRIDMDRYGHQTLERFGKDITDITRGRLREVYQDMKAAGEAQIRRRMLYVQRILKWASDPLDGFLEDNPLGDFTVPKDDGPKKPLRVFSLEDARKILKAAEGSQWHLPFLLYFTTGIRKMALMLRTGNDWDSGRAILTVRKGEGNKVSHEDALPVGKAASQALVSRCVAAVDPLFPSPSGGFHSAKAPWAALQHACKQAGVERGGCHAMRRCCASEIARITGECSTASLALGHVDVKKSLAQSKYIRVGPDDAREAVEELERRLLAEPSELTGTSDSRGADAPCVAALG